MTVRYYAQHGRTVYESVHTLDDLPPNAARVLREDGLDALLTGFYQWRLQGYELWWWVRA